MAKLLTGFFICNILLFGIGQHSEGLRGQLEFEVCHHYGLCYSFDWVNCDNNGFNCEMERKWKFFNRYTIEP